MSEAAREHDAVDAAEGRIFVPEKPRLLPQDVLGDMIDVVVTVGAREDDDSEPHRVSSLLLEFEPEILDHGVGEQLLAHQLKPLLGLLPGKPTKRDLHESADANVGHLAVADLME